MQPGNDQWRYDVGNSIVDLRSDTLSLPDEEMLQAVTRAQLGDDSRDGDPTVRELEAVAAEMMGKDAAMLTISGTMSNLIALRTHTQPGGRAIVERTAHLYATEFGGLAVFCGLLAVPVPGRAGAMDVGALDETLRNYGPSFPNPGLVCLENTHNAAGGTVITPEHLDRCSEVAREHGMAVHLDGARIFNAAVALKVEAARIARSADSVCFCLSKGLSAPVGSVLAGSAAFIDRARKMRRALGGAMRQAGIVAAPGLVALRKMVGRLEEDHENARVLAAALAATEGLAVDMASVQTNIVNVDVAGLNTDAPVFAQHLQAHAVRAYVRAGTMLRFVTYRNISRADVLRAVEAVRTVAAARPWTKTFESAKPA